MPFLNEKYFLQMVRTVDNLADVPSAQANVTIVRNALTNLNGRYLSAYTATYTTIGGYACYQIKRGGSVLDAVKASEYMEYMTGSKFVPTYNYEKPINSLFIFATDFTLWKPQYDPTNGLLLFAAGRLTLYSDLMDLKNVTELEINNLKSIVYETVAAIEELDENYAGILPNPTTINSKPVIDDTKCQVAKIFGNSAVKNQKSSIQTKAEATINGITYSISNGVLVMSGTSTNNVYNGFEAVDLIANHKYLISNYHLMLYATIGGTNYSLGQDNQNDYAIVTCAMSGNYTYQTDIRSGVTVNKQQELIVVDLTQYFGSNDNIPADLLADPTLWYKYIKDTDYNAGELVDSVVNKIVSFSQLWDEQWEVGGISATDGSNVVEVRIRSKNFILVKPNTQYYFYMGFAGNGRVFYYDKDQNFISPASWGTNTTFTTPSNCHFIRFTGNDIYGTTYRNDISIYCGSTNRGYIPYSKLGEILINQTLKGAINAHDILEFVEQENGTFNAIKTSNIGSADLGTLNWVKNTDVNGGFAVNSNDMQSVNIKFGLCKILNAKYSFYNQSFNWSNFSDLPDNILAKNESNYALYCKDTSKASLTAEQFKAAMSGVMLNFELATPTTEVIATGLTLDEVAFLIKLGGYIETESDNVAPNIKLAYIVKDFQE